MNALRNLVLASLAGAAFSAHSATYSGNGSLDFGGPVGTGTLSLSDNGTTISGTLTKGSGSLNDSLVIYIDSTAGGFADTSGFADANDGLRKSISGFDGGANRSLMTFASGFSPDYAIALGPQNASFGGLWQLANGGGNSLNFVSSVNLTPTGGGTGASPTFTFSFDFSQIGLASPASFKLFGTYVSDSGYRSLEAIAGNDTGAQGWNPFTQTAFGVYAVPEPSSLALIGLAVAGVVGLRRHK